MLKTDYIFQLYAFVLGSCVGSFVNVCIYRLPRDLAIARTRSRCMRCGSKVPWYDNIPIWSYLYLKGRCRACGSPFGVVHVLIEAFLGLLAWRMFQNEVFTFSTFYWFCFATALVIVSIIDLEHKIIPDIISIPGIVLGVSVAGLTSWLGNDWPVTFWQSLVGGAFGGGLLWIVGAIYERITDREGIGFGDVKLLALFGVHVGIPGVITSLFFGSFLGALFGLVFIVYQKKGKRTPIPFGPFLCSGLAIYATIGQKWIYWLFPL